MQEKKTIKTKKEILIKILDKLIPYRDLADGIKAVLETIELDDKIIDGILEIINQALKETKTETQRERLQKSIDMVKKIRENEDKEINDAEEILSGL